MRFIQIWLAIALLWWIGLEGIVTCAVAPYAIFHAVTAIEAERPDGVEAGMPLGIVEEIAGEADHRAWHRRWDSGSREYMYPEWEYFPVWYYGECAIEFIFEKRDWRVRSDYGCAVLGKTEMIWNPYSDTWPPEWKDK